MGFDREPQVPDQHGKPLVNPLERQEPDLRVRFSGTRTR